MFDLIVAPGEAHRIIRDVATAHGLRPDDIVGPSTRANVVDARQAAVRRVRSELGYSFPRIGRIFNRHHATMMWACGWRPKTGWPAPPEQFPAADIPPFYAELHNG